MTESCQNCGGEATLHTDDQGTRPICLACGHDPFDEDQIAWPKAVIIMLGAGLFWAFIVHFWGG